MRVPPEVAAQPICRPSPGQSRQELTAFTPLPLSDSMRALNQMLLLEKQTMLKSVRLQSVRLQSVRLQPVRLQSVRLLAIAAALFMCITPARAADHYTGLGIGAFQMDGGVGSKTAAGAYIQLGHEFMDYLSAEVRIGTAGSATKNNEKMQLDWLVAHFIRPYYDISGDLSVYGLAGFSVNHSSYQVGAGSKLKKTNISLSFGGGMQLDLGNQLSVGAEWVSYAREADASRRATSFQGLNVSSFTGTLKYEF